MKYFSDTSPFGCAFPIDSEPHLIMKHIDGPLLHFSDGQMHWLTLWERLMVRIGRENALSFQRKLRPNLTRILDAARKKGRPND